MAHKFFLCHDFNTVLAQYVMVTEKNFDGYFLFRLNSLALITSECTNTLHL